MYCSSFSLEYDGNGHQIVVHWISSHIVSLQQEHVKGESERQNTNNEEERERETGRKAEEREEDEREGRRQWKEEQWTKEQGRQQWVKKGTCTCGRQERTSKTANTVIWESFVVICQQIFVQ